VTKQLKYQSTKERKMPDKSRAADNKKVELPKEVIEELQKTFLEIDKSGGGQSKNQD
jgi:hypothetical protein